MEQQQDSFWKKCSSCKKPIAYGASYYVCSVSTCNGLRTGYVFCSMPCFEVHLPGARHRDAGGIKKVAPLSHSETLEAVSQPSTQSVRRKIIPQVSESATITKSSNSAPQEILIVASKLKDYIRVRSDMNTSGSVMEVLSDLVRRACDEAIENARQDGRKTVLDRDFKKS